MGERTRRYTHIFCNLMLVKQNTAKKDHKTAYMSIHRRYRDVTYGMCQHDS